MKKLIRRWLGADREGYDVFPDALEDEQKILTKIAIVNCENGGKVVTTERRAAGGWEYKAYMVPEGQDLMAIIATVLVEARLK